MCVTAPVRSGESCYRFTTNNKIQKAFYVDHF